MDTKKFVLNERLAKDSFVIAHGPLSEVLVLNDCRFPWIILVPRIDSRIELYQLSEAESTLLTKESNCIGRGLMRAFNGDKLNVASIGNVVSQLHLHHVVRFSSDPCWPAPVWGYGTALPYKKAELEHFCNNIQSHTSKLFQWCDMNDLHL